MAFKRHLPRVQKEERRMSTTGEQTKHYCKRYGNFCTGANERGECSTTACWNNTVIGTGVEYNWGEIYKYGGYQTGWRCPACGRINAPWMPSCTCRGITMGEWIPIPDDEDGYTCSICNAYMKAYKGVLSNYCPNCGVKMYKRKV